MELMENAYIIPMPIIFVRENMYAFNNCLECDDVITNPICTECLASRMRMVIKEHDQSLANEIRGIEVKGETTCIFCNKKMAICAHCFSREVYDFVLERNVTAAEDFLSKFDFDLRRDVMSRMTSH
jgi:hypothetical protein